MIRHNTCRTAANCCSAAPGPHASPACSHARGLGNRCVEVAHVYYSSMQARLYILYVALHYDGLEPACECTS